MNLKAFRKFLVTQAGRYDLVNDDFSDNGIDSFIIAGSKYLDNLNETQKSWGVSYQNLAIDEISISLPYCRAIKEVWAISSTEGRWEVEKKDFKDLMDEYLAALPSEMESGTIEYYSPCITRIIPSTTTLSSYQENLSYISVAGNEYNGILFNVPTSEAISIMVSGLFYSNPLTSDTSSNYWTDEHPILLYMSTMRQIEIITGTTQGLKTWEASIATEMRLLGMNLIEEEIAKIDRMED